MKINIIMGILLLVFVITLIMVVIIFKTLEERLKRKVKKIEQGIDSTLRVTRRNKNESIRLKIILLDNGIETKSYDFNIIDKVIIGNSSVLSDLVILDENISGEQLELSNENGMVIIRNLQSSVNIFVNGTLLKERVRIQSKDLIFLGSNKLRILIQNYGG